MSVLLPHEVLDALARSTPFAFSNLVLGQLEDAARVCFWEHIRAQEPWCRHPALDGSVPLKKLVPICIHADGAQFYRDDEYFVYSWSSAFGPMGTIKDTLITKFPLAIIPERQMKSPDVPWSSKILLHKVLVLLCLFRGESIPCLVRPGSSKRQQSDRGSGLMVDWSFHQRHWSCGGL